MKPIVFGAVLLTLLTSVPARAQDNAEESAIKQRAAEWILAWSTHDPKRLAGFWAEDGDLILPSGSGVAGRAEVEKVLQQELATTLKDSTYELKIQAVHFIKPDVALVDWTGVMHDMRTSDGKALPPQTEHVTAVLVKELDQWFFASTRPGPFSGHS